jgi:hypothetical protein
MPAADYDGAAMSLAEIAAALSAEEGRRVSRRGLGRARRACEARGIELGDFLDAMERDQHHCRVDPAIPRW